eukprot:scaffold2161_cov212-Alexandrium_tamarense.AAC.17
MSAGDQRNSNLDTDIYLDSNHGGRQAFASVCLPERHTILNCGKMSMEAFSHDGGDDFGREESTAFTR